MSGKDVRWTQRFSNYNKAIEKLRHAIQEYHVGDMSELEKEGLVQRFEYTFELAWKTLQDLLYHKGYLDIKGPSPVLKQALQDGYISGESAWRKMKEARELTSHTYDEGEADKIVSKIAKDFFDLLLNLKKRLELELEK